MKGNWCEHPDKICRYTTLKFDSAHGDVLLRVQTWMCPECGVHGADTEIVKPQTAGSKSAS